MAKDPPKERHDHGTLHFPKGFLWGAANSAFQSEGNTTDSDWWEWEQTNQPVDKRSGIAVDHYHRFEEDFSIAQKLGHNAHRLSLEWSRIEPAEGVFDQAEIDHYKEVLKTLKDKNISVMLTLHHFSNPAWFAHQGGWVSLKAPFYFERFVKKVIPEFKEYVDLWITINEPSVAINFAYYTGDFPPGHKKDYWGMFWGYLNMARAHKKAYKAIHDLIPNAQVGLANAVQTFNNLQRHSLRGALAQWGLDLGSNNLIYMFTGKDTHDFLGLNYYTNQYISFNGQSQVPGFLDLSKNQQEEVSDMGWEIYPQGIFEVLMDFADYHQPIYITENGIASTNDDRRVRFLISYLQDLFHAIKAGADVRGYFYWSLTDNMELHRGFDLRFGLVEVNKALKRRIRPSAWVYKDIIKNNGIPHYLLRLLGHSINVSDVMALDHLDVSELHDQLLADKQSS